MPEGTVATFCEVTLDQAKAEAQFGYSHSRGARLDCLRSTLKALWNGELVETKHGKQPLESLDFGDAPRIVLIREAGKKWSHWIVIERGYVIATDQSSCFECSLQHCVSDAERSRRLDKG